VLDQVQIFPSSVAALHGFVLGGGLELALHVRPGGRDDASYAGLEVMLGIIRLRRHRRSVHS